jgi:hypothetical protein
MAAVHLQAIHCAQCVAYKGSATHDKDSLPRRSAASSPSQSIASFRTHAPTHV